MKRSFYAERDNAFGQRMLALRSAIGLTQAALAQHLGVSRKAVGGWELGENYPNVEHLKALIELAMRASAFPVGREEEEIRALWQAAQQKVQLDESWLATVLSQHPSLLAAESVQTSPRADGVRCSCWGTTSGLGRGIGRAQLLWS
jgi:transcriptional regulator with XRE-family HTH domain